MVNKEQIGTLYPIEDLRILDAEYGDLAGEKVKTRNLRVRTILEERNCATPGCPNVATHVGLTPNGHPQAKLKFHVNFYAYSSGNPILMTIDHIVPKSKGGEHRRDNVQAMCSPCNWRKGSN